MFLGLFSLEVVGRDLARTLLGVLVLDLLELLVLTSENTLLTKLSLLRFLILLRSSVRWVVDGSFLEVSMLLVLVVLLPALVILVSDDRELFACAAASPGGSLVSSGAGCAALLDGDSRAVPIDLPGQDLVSGHAGRQGVEQPAPGMRRGFRSLTGALSQARKMHRRAIESLNTSFVPHSRLFSLHPSLLSQNSSLSHGLGAMNSCGSMHGLCMHGNLSVMHDNSWGALEHNNSCSLHAAGVR